MIDKAFTKFIPVRDCCGDDLPGEPSFDKAVTVMEDAGWVRRLKNGEWENICPKCQEGKV